jgi:MoaA/NifB/PqqE/SkfB family radical SAM enzyme
VARLLPDRNPEAGRVPRPVQQRAGDDGLTAAAREQPARILQLHPTLRCNLACRHCYSTSGPTRAETLPVQLLEGAVEDAGREGYGVVSVSGGEPLLYRPLSRLLERAHDVGMVTTVTTNGLLLTPRNLASLTGRVDLVAISLDGRPSTHDRMRGSPRAFSTLLSRLSALRDSGIPFGFIVTVTKDNIDDLPWVADFAVASGARLLQLHPLEQVGRARDELAGATPDAYDSAQVWFTALQLQARYGEQLHVQLDIADRQVLIEEPERTYAGPFSADEVDRPLAEIVSPLVIETDGTVVPSQHGIDRRLALGNLTEHRLTELAVSWRATGYRAFREASQRALSALAEPSEFPFLNWFDVIRTAAEASPDEVSGRPQVSSLPEPSPSPR